MLYLFIYTFLRVGHIKIFKNQYPGPKFQENREESVSLSHQNVLCLAVPDSNKIFSKCMLTDLDHTCYHVPVAWKCEISCQKSQNLLVKKIRSSWY